MARILIVEDDADLAAVLDDCLRHEGYATGLSGTGVEALDLLSRGQYDVMLLDRDLPVLSGDEVMHTVDRLRIPVRTLMLTAAGGIEDRVQGLDLGADDYLPKPFAYARSCAAATRTTRPPCSPAAACRSIPSDGSPTRTADPSTSRPANTRFWRNCCAPTADGSTPVRSSNPCGRPRRTASLTSSRPPCTRCVADCPTPRSSPRHAGRDTAYHDRHR